ncbi:MAG: hypothetical protein JWN25_3276 [Verrucomicrobiales bacterium]|nr:hypothetical protein [Verrucomicrobiales bacterium]
MVVFCVVSLLIAVVRSSYGQAILVDPDSLVSTNIPGQINSVEALLGVVRFIPKGALKPYLDQNPTDADCSQLVKRLSKDGQVNLLYSGNRFFGGGQGDHACFTSLEKRPNFTLGGAAPAADNEYGIHLDLLVTNSAENVPEVRWQGDCVWSTDLINTWAGEKYLLFGMKLAKILKPGMVYTTTDPGSDDDVDEGNGINIGKFFRKKKPEKKEEPPAADKNPSFIPADRQVLKWEGKGNPIVRSTQIKVLPGDDKIKELIFVVLQFIPDPR